MERIRQKSAEREKADQKFRLTVEASPNGIVLATSDGRMVLVNAQTEKLFGYSRGELIGHTVEMLLPERFRGAHPGHRAEFFTAPKARAMGAGRELFARRKDGTEFPVEIGLSPIQTEEGTLVLTAIVDITERRKAEDELAQNRNELSHLSRVTTMSELSSSLAHELNQPLAIILTNAQAAQRLLAQEPPDVGETRDILADIVSEDERAGEVIRRLRAQLKPGQTQRLPVSVNEIIEGVLLIARSDLIGRGVTVHTALAEGVPQVLGDRIQLQQVFLNLILNASDAMAANPRAQRHLTIATAHREGLVRISFSDTGCGLPAEPERIFQPFYTTKKDGLGLGLPICRSIVTLHQGRLWAEANKVADSSPAPTHTGQGTTLHLELPAAEGKT
jgi:two-component system sensor kinase FixL